MTDATPAQRDHYTEADVSAWRRELKVGDEIVMISNVALDNRVASFPGRVSEPVKIVGHMQGPLRRGERRQVNNLLSLENGMKFDPSTGAIHSGPDADWGIGIPADYDIDEQRRRVRLRTFIAELGRSVERMSREQVLDLLGRFHADEQLQPVPSEYVSKFDPDLETPESNQFAITSIEAIIKEAIELQIAGEAHAVIEARADEKMHLVCQTAAALYPNLSQPEDAQYLFKCMRQEAGRRGLSLRIAPKTQLTEAA